MPEPRKQPLRIRMRFAWARWKTRQKRWWKWSLRHPFRAKPKPTYGVDVRKGWFARWRARVDRHILERRQQKSKHTRPSKKDRRRARRKHQCG